MISKATAGEGVQVRGALGKNLDSVRSQMQRHKDLLAQKQLVIAEALDVLSAQNDVDTKLDFEKHFLPLSVLHSSTRNIERNYTSCTQMVVRDTWTLIIRDTLCVGVELENLSRERSVADVRAYLFCDGEKQPEEVTSRLLSAAMHPRPVHLLRPRTKCYLVLCMEKPGWIAKSEMKIMMNWTSGTVSGREQTHPVLQPNNWSHFQAQIAIINISPTTTPHLRTPQQCLSVCLNSTSDTKSLGCDGPQRWMRVMSSLTSVQRSRSLRMSGQSVESLETKLTKLAVLDLRPISFENEVIFLSHSINFEGVVLWPSNEPQGGFSAVLYAWNDSDLGSVTQLLSHHLSPIVVSLPSTRPTPLSELEKERLLQEHLSDLHDLTASKRSVSGERYRNENTAVVATTAVYETMSESDDLTPLLRFSDNEKDKKENVLLHGGNAVDAAVASTFCIGLMDPHSTGIGGGAFLTIYTKKTGKCAVIDAREVAPTAATKFMFNNASSTTGWKAIAVPGQVHGLRHAFETFGSGRISWKSLVQPTADLAANGFPVSYVVANGLKGLESKIINEPTMQIFINPNSGELYKEGEIMKRPVLAATLQKLADSSDPIGLFYNGSIADIITHEFQANGAILTKQDLIQYRSLQRKEIMETTIKNQLTICGPPPPSSSAIVQAILNIMSGFSFNLTTVDENVLTYHRLIEAMKFAYAERSKLGDMDFVPESLQLARQVASDSHAQWVRQQIGGSSFDTDFYGGEFEAQEDHGTTNLNVVDPDGNAVAITSTINTLFGSKRRSPGTGIIWNNDMDDFSSPGQVNAFDFPPSPANYIEPGKRPLSSMSPTIIYDKSGNVKMCIGAAGGSKIISAIAYIAMRSLWFNETVKESVDAPRIHNQLKPNNTLYEHGFPELYAQELRKRGHIMTENRGNISIATAILRTEDSILYANSDYRKGTTSYPAGF